MYQIKHWLRGGGFKSWQKKHFFLLLPYQEWLWQPLRLWAYRQLFFHKVVDSCNKYKNYDLPPPSTIVRNTSSTSNYLIHTFWHGLFKCNPFLSCQRERLPTMLFSRTCPVSGVFFEQTNKSMAYNNCMLSFTPCTLPSATLVADCVLENQMAGNLQFPTVKCPLKFLNKWNFGW